MFKTDDKLVQICLAVSYAILALYGMINYFNPEYIINNYASLESNDTNRFFLGWYGMMNFGAVAGLIYMGYKGLGSSIFYLCYSASSPICNLDLYGPSFIT